jgi:hypothetical protein
MRTGGNINSTKAEKLAKWTLQKSERSLKWTDLSDFCRVHFNDLSDFCRVHFNDLSDFCRVHFNDLSDFCRVHFANFSAFVEFMLPRQHELQKSERWTIWSQQTHSGLECKNQFHNISKTFYIKCGFFFQLTYFVLCVL